ncbi:MAG: alpha/beta hydrolase [Rhodospirillales bacterium]
MDFTAEDIVYQSPDNTPLLARLYRPSGSGPFPAVLEVHGGAWTGGDRFNNVSIAESLAADGIVVLSIDFRMPPVARYPVTCQDVSTGIRFLKAHAVEFGSRPDWVGTLGTSSGGHLVLLAALRPNDPRYTPEGDASVAFSIACWPVADPLKRYRVKKEAGIMRFVASHNAFWPSEAEMEDANPTLILQRGESVAKPPVLAIQGTNDDNLTPDMTSGFASAYAAAGGKVSFESFPGQPHAFIPGNPTSADSLRALDLMKAFIHRNAG